MTGPYVGPVLGFGPEAASEPTPSEPEADTESLPPVAAAPAPVAPEPTPAPPAQVKLVPSWLTCWPGLSAGLAAARACAERLSPPPSRLAAVGLASSLIPVLL